MRQTLSFNDKWQFSKDGYGKETVSLPHTWNAVDGQDGGNDYWRGIAVYSKSFAKPALKPGEHVFIEFQGAAMLANVRLNGKELCRHAGGYSTFRTELTPELREENVLTVTVDNGPNNWCYPQKADFTFYGGLYVSPMSWNNESRKGMWIERQRNGGGVRIRIVELLDAADMPAVDAQITPRAGSYSDDGLGQKAISGTVTGKASGCMEISKRTGTLTKTRVTVKYENYSNDGETFFNGTETVSGGLIWTTRYISRIMVTGKRFVKEKFIPGRYLSSL